MNNEWNDEVVVDVSESDITVDQAYNATSSNPQSGTAVAGAIAGVKQVPASTSEDASKVLTVSSEGVPGWAPAQGGGGGSSVEAGAGLVKSGDTLSVNAYRGLRIGEPISGITINKSDCRFEYPNFKNSAHNIKCLYSMEASGNASYEGTTAHIVVGNQNNSVYGVSTFEFEVAAYGTTYSYIPASFYADLVVDSEHFTMNDGHTFDELGDSGQTVYIFVTLKNTSGDTRTPNGELPLPINYAYLSSSVSLNEIFYPPTVPPDGKRSFLTANYSFGYFMPYWVDAYPKPTSADAGKVLQVQADGSLAWVTLS